MEIKNKSAANDLQVEALAVKLTQEEGELIQEKFEVKKLANFLKQVVMAHQNLHSFLQCFFFLQNHTFLNQDSHRLVLFIFLLNAELSRPWSVKKYYTQNQPGIPFRLN